jgi:hypothetical protein
MLLVEIPKHGLHCRLEAPDLGPPFANLQQHRRCHCMLLLHATCHVSQARLLHHTSSLQSAAYTADTTATDDTSTTAQHSASFISLMYLSCFKPSHASTVACCHCNLPITVLCCSSLSLLIIAIPAHTPYTFTH